MTPPEYIFWLDWNGCAKRAEVLLESEFATPALLKRRVPVKESVVGRDPLSVGAAAPKLCNVDSAQAAADVGEKSASPPELFAVAVGFGIGEDEDGFFC